MLTKEEFQTACDSFLEETEGTEWRKKSLKGTEFLAKRGVRDQVCYEFHVLFSEVFNVPVFYLNVFQPDGMVVGDAQVKSVFCRCQVQTELSQVMHPLLDCPVWMLHPCQTEKILTQLMQEQKGKTTLFVRAFLSAVSQIICI